MVNNTVNATYTETYDLNTAIGELSLLAIHTPQAAALRRMFRGFFTQYKKLKILGCNFQMVCASKQELTPDLVGLEAGQVDPRDVLNPILFKACTGENLNVFLNQIYNNNSLAAGGSSVSQHIDTRTVAETIYYSMLADDSWRKSHPQAGLTVTGLRPMVHKIVSTQPFKFFGQTTTGGVEIGPSTSSSNGVTVVGAGGPSAAVTSSPDATNPTVLVSNGITEMPWLDTTTQRSSTFMNSSSSTTSGTSNAEITAIPRCYCGLLILPPAILQSLYFRLRITWFVQFRDFRPAIEVGPINANASSSGYHDGAYGMASTLNQYWNMYHTPAASSKYDQLTDYSSFDTNKSAQVEQIMENVK